MPGKSNDERLEEILATCLADPFVESGCAATCIAGAHEPPPSVSGFRLADHPKDERAAALAEGSVLFV